MIIKTPVDLDLTINSGQTSQPPWILEDETYSNVILINDEPVIFNVKQSGDYLDFNFKGNVQESEAISKLNYIFDLDFDLNSFYKYLNGHDELKDMSKFCNGLRLFLARTHLNVLFHQFVLQTIPLNDGQNQFLK